MSPTQSSQIAALIERDRDALIAQWRDFAKTTVPAALEMNNAELEGGVAELLAAFVADLRSSQPDLEREDKSHCSPPRVDSGLSDAERAHARSRARAGFPLDQCISEFRALRASVMRLAVRQGVSDARAVADLARFNEAIDEAVAALAAQHGRIASQARDMFVAVLGHDLRAPLSDIKMSAHQLLLLGASVPAGEALGRQVMRGATRMTQLLDNLLDFDRARAGVDLPLDPSQVDFAAICREAIAESSAAHPNARITVDCPPRLVGRWDSARLGQLISNLVANAVAYGAPGRPINVALREDERGFAELLVHNEGLPIPPEEFEDIFDPLGRGVPWTSSQASRGSGLGLFVVKSIAQAQRGDVSVTSTAEAGTTFRVALPREW